MIEKLIELMKSADIDALVLARRSNVRYATGVLADSTILVIGCEMPPAILTPPLELYRVQDLLSDRFEIVRYEWKPIDKLIEVLGDSKRIGYDSIPPELAKRLREENREIVDLSERIAKLRSIKTEREIEMIERSLRIAERALEDALASLDSFEKERDLAGFIEMRLRQLGSEDDHPFTPIVASGRNSAYPHHRPTDSRLEKPLILDLGARFSGYCSDLTRTLLESRSSLLTDAREAVVEAMNASIKEAREGVKCSDLYQIAKNVLDEYGFGDKFLHGLGHGVGIDVHEEPAINPVSMNELRSGMVVTIEPGVYIKRLGGVRIEDMIVVEKSSARILTRMDRFVD